MTRDTIWTMRGRSATAQSSPGENSLYLFYSLFSNMMARCVARNPNEIVRQLAAARELDFAMVVEVFKPESRLISFCRRELSCLLAGRLGTLRCRPRPVLRRGQLSLAWTIGRWRRRVAAIWASPRLNNTKSFNLPFVCWSITIWPTQVLDTISLFNHVLRESLEGTFCGPKDLSYFVNVHQFMFLFCPVRCIGLLFK